MSVSYVKLHSRGRRGFAFGAIGAESGAAMTWQMPSPLPVATFFVLAVGSTVKMDEAAVPRPPRTQTELWGSSCLQITDLLLVDTCHVGSGYKPVCTGSALPMHLPVLCRLCAGVACCLWPHSLPVLTRQCGLVT